jgi:hypothetical protein
MNLDIQPLIYPKLDVRMTIDVTVILSEKAFVRVSFYEKDNEYQPVDVKVLCIEGEEYKNWGNDDSYIKELVFKKLNINI